MNEVLLKPLGRSNAWLFGFECMAARSRETMSTPDVDARELVPSSPIMVA